VVGSDCIGLVRSGYDRKYVTISFLAKFRTFGFILEKYATVATDTRFSSYYVITKARLTHALSVRQF
jgi:hypothetical protein